MHKNSVSVCLLPFEGQADELVKRRNFPTFTRFLKQLRSWLKKSGVTDIAMEPTGQYWRPLRNVLEGGFERLLLVNPQHIKGLDGRKTDRRDAQWIAGVAGGQAVEGQLGADERDSRVQDLTRQRVHTKEDLTRVRNPIE